MTASVSSLRLWFAFTRRRLRATWVAFRDYAEAETGKAEAGSEKQAPATAIPRRSAYAGTVREAATQGMKLVHQTPDQFLARFRERYRVSSGEEAARLAAWLADRLDAGDVTDAQLRVAFGKTAGEAAAFVTKAKALRDARATLVAARGE